MNELYSQITEIIKAKGKIYSYHLLNFARIEIKPYKVLIFDLDTGSIRTHETNEINKKTHVKTYFIGKHEPDIDIQIRDVENLINELELNLKND